MSNTVGSVPLKRLQTPVHDGLQGYEQLSNGAVVFDRHAAVDLQLTPDKPNSARSTSDVKHRGEVVGKLVVIVFAPGDGSGDESTFRLTDITKFNGYPKEPKIVPRAKRGIHSEIHLTLASHDLGRHDNEPTLYAGNLDLVGFGRSEELRLLGELGQGRGRFTEICVIGTSAKPTATLTVGHWAHSDFRFGDPHSVYNALPKDMQICGFLALSQEMVLEHPELITELRAAPPVLLTADRSAN